MSSVRGEVTTLSIFVTPKYGVVVVVWPYSSPPYSAEAAARNKVANL